MSKRSTRQLIYCLFSVSCLSVAVQYTYVERVTNCDVFESQPLGCRGSLLPEATRLYQQSFPIQKIFRSTKSSHFDVGGSTFAVNMLISNSLLACVVRLLVHGDLSDPNDGLGCQLYFLLGEQPKIDSLWLTPKSNCVEALVSSLLRNLKKRYRACNRKSKCEPPVSHFLWCHATRFAQAEAWCQPMNI